MRNQKGITLIALVITIIVLLILAGVSIAMLTGQNGILTRANEAQTETAYAEIEERMGMAIQSVYADKIKPNATVTTVSITNIVSQYNLDNSGHSTATDNSSTKANTIKVTMDSVDYIVELETSGQSMKVKSVTK